MKSRSLTFKVFFMVFLLLTATASAGLFGLYQSHRAVAEYQQLMTQNVAIDRGVKLALIEFKTQVQEWKNTLLRGSNSEQREKYWTAFQTREASVVTLVDGVLEIMPEGEVRGIVESFKAAHKEMGAGYRMGFDSFVQSGFNSAVGDKAVKGMDRAPAALLQQSAELVESSMQGGSDHARDAVSRTEKVSGLLLGSISILGLFVAFFLARSITRQIGGDPHIALETVTRIANGDMSVPVPLRANDRSSVLAGVERMRQNLVKIVGQVLESSSDIASGASRFAEAGVDQNGRMEKLAASLEETAASMDELGSTVKQNADHAKEADKLAKTASSVARSGGDVVADVVSTMAEINSSSQKIVNITAVIDSIAFQTNLLALNAAVEAARAGEEGRGFAVVASEVRALAHRSASAANEIKELITNSVERVEKGGQLVDKAGSTMQEVVSSINRVTELVGDISNATVEQSSAVALVGQSVSEMDRSTHQSTSAIEESAAAASRLREQSSELVSAVSQFTID